MCNNWHHLVERAETVGESENLDWLPEGKIDALLQLPWVRADPYDPSVDNEGAENERAMYIFIPEVP